MTKKKEVETLLESLHRILQNEEMVDRYCSEFSPSPELNEELRKVLTNIFELTKLIKWRKDVKSKKKKTKKKKEAK